MKKDMNIRRKWGDKGVIQIEIKEFHNGKNDLE